MPASAVARSRACRRSAGSSAAGAIWCWFSASSSRKRPRPLREALNDRVKCRHRVELLFAELHRQTLRDLRELRSAAGEADAIDVRRTQVAQRQRLIERVENAIDVEA